MLNEGLLFGLAEGGGSNAIETTYADLVSMRSSGTLKPGALYRITDYVTKINGTYDISEIAGQAAYIHYAKSAEHPFDIIVLADSNCSLNENALALLHDGDEYFETADLTAWEIKYTIYNNPERFSWADETNGKGVIYYMKDEYNNEAGYDFKNIQFLAYSLGMADPNAEENRLCAGDPIGYPPKRMGSVYYVFQALKSYLEYGTYSAPFPSSWGNDFKVGASILTCVGYPAVDDTYLQTFQADWYYTFDRAEYNSNTNSIVHYEATVYQSNCAGIRDNTLRATPDVLDVSLSAANLRFGLPMNIIQFDATELAGATHDISGNYFGTSATLNIADATDDFWDNIFEGAAYGCAFGGQTGRCKLSGCAIENGFDGNNTDVVVFNDSGVYIERNSSDYIHSGTANFYPPRTTIAGVSGPITLGSGLTMTGSELSASGGGSQHLYWHTVHIVRAGSNVSPAFNLYVNVLSGSSTPLTKDTFQGLLNENTSAVFPVVSGTFLYENLAYVPIEVHSDDGATTQFKLRAFKPDYSANTSYTVAHTAITNFGDTVEQIF